MTEPNDDITDQPKDTPHTRDEVTNESRPPDEGYHLQPAAPRPSSGGNKVVLIVVISVLVGGLLLCCPVAGILLVIPVVSRVREAAARATSRNNLMQMGIAVNNMAGNTPAQAYIPPAAGVFPNGGTVDTTFFFHLLPDLEQGRVYNQYSGNPAQAKVPIKAYFAPADPFNDGTSNLCSYAANAQFLMVSPPSPPRLTNGGRTASTVIVAERSAKTGAVWNQYSPAAGTNPPAGPLFYVYYPPTGKPTQTYTPLYTADSTWPTSALGTSQPTAFTSYGVTVLMLDGSARYVTLDNISNFAWLLACDPVNNQGDMPGNW
jgi:hypothetical protein